MYHTIELTFATKEVAEVVIEALKTDQPVIIGCVADEVDAVVHFWSKAPREGTAKP